MDSVPIDTLDAATHRRLAVDLFNRSWQLLELPRRAPEQDDDLIHTTHASCYHWGEVGGAANRARGENQCARVYAALGRGEPALYHAGRCLDLVRAGGDGFEDWDLASAYEVLTRAHLAAGDRAEAERYAALAREALAAAEDAEDRELIAGQLSELGLDA